MTMMLIAILAIGILSLVIGIILAFAGQVFAVEGDPLVDQIDAILPQTQCGQCGYPGCRPYAEAIANGDEINKCPPGGDSTIAKLAELTGKEAKPLNAAHDADSQVKKVAFIIEEDCIGCTKCIQACPVDAIVGAARQMHTVVSDLCTGCDLCVAPCPTDCIEMRPVNPTLKTWNWQQQAIAITEVH